MKVTTLLTACALAALVTPAQKKADTKPNGALSDVQKALRGVGIQVLKEPDPQIRRKLIEELEGLPGQLRELMIRLKFALLSDQDEEVRAAAASALGAFPTYAESEIGSLVRALKHDQSPKVRATAAASLGRMAPASKKALPYLIARLRDPAELKPVRRTLLFAVARFGKDADAAMPHFVQALSDPEVVPSLAHRASAESMARNATFILSHYELRPNKDTVPGLVKGLKQQDDLNLRMWAAAALGRVGNQHPDVMPTLLKMLRQEDDLHLRACAVGGFAQMGTDGKDAVPDLLHVFAKGKKAEGTNLGILFALGKIGAEKGVVSTLADVLSDPRRDPQERSAAIRAVAEIGPAAVEAVPALLDALRQKKGDVGPVHPMLALKAIGVAGLPDLLQLVLERKSPDLRSSVIHLIGQMGPAAKSALPKLRPLTESMDQEVASVARRAVACIEGRLELDFE